MEIWKAIQHLDIIDFDYEVSNFGNVRSLNYNRTGKTRNLKIGQTPQGNRCVRLAGKQTRSVAQLVLTVFVEPRPSDKHFPYHKDGDASNDNLENLEWRHISLQNGENGKNGHKFQAGHDFGTQFGFKKGHNVGAEYRFKKNNTIGTEHRFQAHAVDVNS
jgi:hypothetical protein